MDRAVLEWLEGVAHAVNAEGQLAAAEVAAAKPEDKVASLKTKFVQLDQRLDQATNKMLDETIPGDAYARIRDDIETQKADIEVALRAAKVTAAKPPAQLAASLLEDWPLLAVDGRRDILSRLIDYIEVKPGRPRAEIAVHRAW